MSASVRPRCLTHTDVNGVQHSSTSLSPESDYLVVRAEVHGPSGVLASVTAQEFGVGMASCPWLIVASPGQRINITLMDFAAYDRSPSVVVAAAAAAGSRSRRDLSPRGLTGQSRRQYDVHTRYCREYAVVSEDTATKNLVVCSDHRPRTRLVYTSRSHRLKVTFSDMTSSTTTGDDDNGQLFFAVKYQGSSSTTTTTTTNNNNNNNHHHHHHHHHICKAPGTVVRTKQGEKSYGIGMS